MRGRSYDSRRIEERNNARNSSTHFLGLECILDKYQHENTMLSQQIKLLLNQNKMLRQRPSNKDPGQLKRENKGFQYSNRQRCKTVCKENNQNLEVEKAPNMQIFAWGQRVGNRKAFINDEEKTQRKYKYLKQKTVGLETKDSSRNQKSSGTKSYNYQYQFSNENLDTGRKTVCNSQTPVKSKTPIFNRQVYLEQETILNVQDDFQKLPTFIQPSFGNIELKISKCDNLDKKKCSDQIDFEGPKQNRTLKQPNFKLGWTEVENKQTIISSIKAEEIKKILTSEKEKENNEVGIGKKTNYPYIKNQFKIAQPKTQLTNIFYPQRKKQQAEAVVNMGSIKDRKTFLNVISKMPKRSLFSK